MGAFFHVDKSLTSLPICFIINIEGDCHYDYM